MSVRHTELMARIGLAGAIVPTCSDSMKNPNIKTQKLIISLQQKVDAAIRFFGRVGSENIETIGRKIDEMKTASCLGKPRSILTFLDFAVEMLERSMDGPGAPGNIRGASGRIYIRAIIGTLVALRLELSRSRNFEICSMAAIKAADVWERL